MRCPDQINGWGSVSITNTPEAGTLNIWVDQEGRMGDPTFSVPVATSITYPLDGAKFLTFAFVPTGDFTGPATIRLMPQVLSSGVTGL